MPQSQSHTTEANQQHVTPIGIVGGGFGSLLSFGALRFRGVAARDITIFSATATPEETWLGFVQMIGQTFMRSESEGHFWPTTSPGLATMEAIDTWSPIPVLRSWFDRYHPTVAFMVEHLRQVAYQLSFWHSLVPCSISRIERDGDVFILFDEAGRPCGRVQHLIMAVGHGPHRIPPVMSRFARHFPQDQRVMHAFGPKVYTPGETVLVLGDGLTSATEWISILEAGASVIAISEAGFTFGQRLNTPRRYFTKRGYASFQSKDGEDRMQELKAATKGTIPFYPGWRKIIKEAQQTGRLQLIQGSVLSVQPLHQGGRLAATVQLSDKSVYMVESDRTVCATGFLPASMHPLWQQVIADYTVPMAGDFIRVADDFSIPSLCTPTSSLTAVGSAAAWAIPCADSLVGMRMAARTIAERIVGPERWSLDELAYKTRQWFTLLQGGLL